MRWQDGNILAARRTAETAERDMVDDGANLREEPQEESVDSEGAVGRAGSRVESVSMAADFCCVRRVKNALGMDLLQIKSDVMRDLWCGELNYAAMPRV